VKQLNSRLRRLETTARPTACPTCQLRHELDEPDPWADFPAERDEYGRIMAGLVERAKGAANLPPCPDCGRKRDGIDESKLLTLATDAELDRMIELLRNLEAIAQTEEPR